mmetsp:Transcript_12148/g.38840  ORF Transcript_12148/g.38840 Transcript_12148/m.38840 type:complete len:319 (-) Transcript_12148:178-1134(-)
MCRLRLGLPHLVREVLLHEATHLRVALHQSLHLVWVAFHAPVVVDTRAEFADTSGYSVVLRQHPVELLLHARLARRVGLDAIQQPLTSLCRVHSRRGSLLFQLRTLPLQSVHLSLQSAEFLLPLVPRHLLLGSRHPRGQLPATPIQLSHLMPKPLTLLLQAPEGNLSRLWQSLQLPHHPVVDLLHLAVHSLDGSVAVLASAEDAVQSVLHFCVRGPDLLQHTPVELHVLPRPRLVQREVVVCQHALSLLDHVQQLVIPPLQRRHRLLLARDPSRLRAKPLRLRRDLRGPLAQNISPVGYILHLTPRPRGPDANALHAP